MAYSKKRMQTLADRLLADLPAFERHAKDNFGILEPTAEALGLTNSSELSQALDADETGTLRTIMERVYSEAVGRIEKRLLTLGMGELEARPQSLTAMLAVLNNRRLGWGTQRVEHSGNVQYGNLPRASAPDQGHEGNGDCECAGVLKLIKPEADGNGTDGK